MEVLDDVSGDWNGYKGDHVSLTATDEVINLPSEESYLVNTKKKYLFQKL